jgi:hypothetical protein
VAIGVPAAVQAAEGPAITFAPKVDYGTAAPAADMLMTDINRDGVADLVTLVPGAGTKPGPETPSSIGVRLGDGTGALGSSTTYNAPSVGVTIDSGDVNGDEIPDIVVGHSGFIFGFTGISVLLGNADGTLQPAVNYPTAAAVVPIDVRLGDFNGDARPDVLALSANAPEVGLFLNNGDGTFASPAVSYPTLGTTLVGGEARDINRDGKVDAVVADQNGGISVLLGDGTGALGAAALQAAVTSDAVGLVLADFTNDDILDAAIPNNTTASVAVAKGNGDGTFAAATTQALPADPNALVAADFNGDRNRDLVASVDTVNQVAVLTGNGAGEFSAALPFGTANGPVEVATGDLNRDDLPDVAAATAATDNPVSVLINTTAPTARSATPDKGSIAGGTAITIEGIGFQPGTTVTVGGAPATSVQVDNGRRITATTPPGSAGAADVVVKRADGKESTLPGAFRYEVPAPTSATFRLNNAGRTVVSWVPAAAAVQGFEVRVDGGNGCTVDGAARSCTLRKAYGPSAQVEVRAFTQTGSSPVTVASYARASKATTVSKVAFSGSSRKLTPKAVRKVRKKARALVDQGWPRVTLRGTGASKALGRQRAKAVRVVVRKATRGQLATSISAARGPNRVTFLVR